MCKTVAQRSAFLVICLHRVYIYIYIYTLSPCAMRPNRPKCSETASDEFLLLLCHTFVKFQAVSLHYNKVVGGQIIYVSYAF